MGAVATYDNPLLAKAPASKAEGCAQVKNQKSSPDSPEDPMFYGRNTTYLGALTALEILHFCEPYAYGVRLSKAANQCRYIAEFETHPPVQLRKEALWAISKIYGGVDEHLLHAWFGPMQTLMREYSSKFPVPE